MGRRPFKAPTQPGHKFCAACGLEKPIEGFTLRPAGFLGRESYCKPCKYERGWKNSKPRSLEAITTSFWAKVTKGGPDDCWIWTGSKNNYGYGMMFVGNRGDGRPINEQVHRLSLELHGVQVPDRKKTGFVVDHACREILCVNPRHLRIVPHAANIGELADRRLARQRVALAKAIGRGELRRKRRPEDDEGLEVA